ncbi:hypothetical protein F1602_19865 [Pseudomonas putida]|nr:hypothetical protein HV87_01200 [Pseudomonas aeruginosa]QEQ89418.1 hypothetical protein F1602_19865 [Pseudomonas putida]
MQAQLSFSKFEKPARFIVGAGLPAKQATRCLAPAAPVFAGTPAPTGRSGATVTSSVWPPGLHCFPQPASGPGTSPT